METPCEHFELLWVNVVFWKQDCAWATVISFLSAAQWISGLSLVPQNFLQCCNKPHTCIIFVCYSNDPTCSFPSRPSTCHGFKGPLDWCWITLHVMRTSALTSGGVKRNGLFVEHWAMCIKNDRTWDWTLYSSSLFKVLWFLGIAIVRQVSTRGDLEQTVCQ